MGKGRKEDMQEAREPLSMWEPLQKTIELLRKGKRNRPLAIEFLEVAEQDMKASEVLYDQELYALSTFHLQQAIEKTVKSIGYLYGISDARSLEHTSAKGLIKILEQYREFVTPFFELAKVLTQVSMPSISETLAQAKGGLEDLSADPKWLRIEYERIQSFLSIADQLRQGVNAKFEEIKESISQSIPQNYFKAFERSLRFALDYITLYFLATLTFCHESCTRYPDDKRILKPKEYSSELGIVKASPRIREHLQEVLENLKQE